MTLSYSGDDTMRYGNGVQTIETTLELVHPASGRQTEMTFDCLHTPLAFMAENQLWPTGERLEDRIEVLLREGERELSGTAGTALDGVTNQQIIDGWRALQCEYRLVITIEVPDEALLDEFANFKW